MLVDRWTVFDKPSGSYANNNQFTVSASGQFTISNGGTFEQAAGTLDLDGSMTLMSGSKLDMMGGTLDLSGFLNLQLSTDRINLLTGGVLNLAGLISGPGVFTQDGGTLNQGAGALFGGEYEYLGGTINGTPVLSNTTLTIGPAATDPVSFLLQDGGVLIGDVHVGQTLNVLKSSASVVPRGMTSATGFNNNGSILLTASDAAGGATLLQLDTGTLTNSATGLLHFQAGGSAGRLFTGNLANSGTVEIDHPTTFDKSGGQYANSGLLTINSTLQITAGALTNFASNTLTGGTYDVAGTFRFPGADIGTNQAEIILRGASSQILNHATGADALANLAAIGPAGALRLFSGRNFAAAGAFSNQGELELGGTTFSASSLTNTGVIMGHGTIIGIVMNTTGTVAPGSSSGTLQFNGIYTQGPGGLLAVELASPANHDRLEITGTATLDGGLAVSLLGGFSPEQDDTFEFLTAASVTGTFDQDDVLLPNLSGDLDWRISYGATNVSLIAYLPGDYNHNGRVDAADYTVWRNTLGPILIAGTGADGTGPEGKPDGIVNRLDYDFWKAHYGARAEEGSGSYSSHNVPEPSSVTLVCFGAAAASCIVFGRRGRT